MEAATIPIAHAEDPADRIAVLFDLYHQQLHRLALRLCGNDGDARDLVQETYLRAARSARSIPSGHDDERAWLTRVLVNIRRDQWRRTRTRAWLHRLHGGPSDTSASGEAALIARDTIWRALDRLTPRRRAVLVMHELDGHSIADIARTLGIAIVTVRWHLAVARRELRASILPEGGAP
jgi:RNA polymerase sigma-70 factor (ECF subfamily)